MTRTELSEDGSSRFVQTKKWRMHYHEAGEGRPMVLLHGSGPGATGWSNFAPNLAALSREHRVIAVDMPGWGESDTAVPEDRDHVEALELFLDELDIERVALLGNSMGGMTAQRFTVTHPARVSHLVTMGSAAPGVGVFGARDGMTEGLRALLAAYFDPQPEAFKQLVRLMTYDHAFATDELAGRRCDTALAHPEHLQNFLLALGHGTFAGGSLAAFAAIADKLGQLSTPALIIHGRDDRVVPYESSLRLLSLIPNARLLVFNNCGHWAQLEHLEEFNRAVAQFVAHA